MSYMENSGIVWAIQYNLVFLRGLKGLVNFLLNSGTPSKCLVKMTVNTYNASVTHSINGPHKSPTRKEKTGC